MIFPVAIQWTAVAATDVRKIERETALRILHVLTRYSRTGDGDVKRLQDIDPAEFRLRVGDYRVRFRQSQMGIEIISVRHRREAYRA